MFFKSLIPWRKKDTDVKVRDEGYEDYAARFRDEFESLMQGFFGDPRWNSRFPSSSLWSDSERFWNGGWDLGWEDKDDKYVLRVELPGFEAEDFDIKVVADTLTVKAEHKEEKKGEHGAGYRYGSFSRSFTLPKGVDEQHIDARYHSGVLEIHLAKTEECQAKRIEVKSA